MRRRAVFRRSFAIPVHLFRLTWPVIVTASACGGSHAAAPLRPAAPAAPATSLAPQPAVVAAAPTPIADRYRATAARIIAALTGQRRAYARLSYLTDRIGNRLSGSAALETAVTWAEDGFAADGHAHVHHEPVTVPHWVRGDEAGEIVAPVQRKLALLALGGSAGTDKDGLTAEVVVVTDFDALDKLGTAVAGKIVLFDHPMPPFGPSGPHYGETVAYRNRGPARASKLGAVAVLVRTVTARSLRSPHTGMTRFPPDVTRIPAVAVSTEDADLIARLAAGGPVRVHLTLGAKLLPDASSANVLAEIVGRDAPSEIVLIGAHLDSWDVGQGAHDDGAGVAIVMETMATLRRLGLQPRRTIRAVLYTNEENGVRGAKAYRDVHGKDDHVAAIEADRGGFHPEGFELIANPKSLAQVREIATLLGGIGAAKVEAGEDAGADVEELLADVPEGAPPPTDGVQELGLVTEGSRYFDYHHSNADTLDKVDADDLELDVAALAVMTWVLADMPERLGK